MCRFSKLIFCILCSLLTQQVFAQWHKINFSYHNAELLTSVIKYKNTIYTGDFLKGVLYSEDYCKTWRVLNGGLTSWYGDFSINNFYSDSTGFYVLNFDGLYKLNEVTKYWLPIVKNPMISLGRNGQVFIGGVNGNGIYFSTDNGVTWLRNYQTAGMIWNARSVVVLNDKFFISGDNGVYFTTDNGQSWQNVLGINTRQLLLKNDTLFAATSEGVKYTINAGENWANVGKPNMYIKNIEIYNDKFFGGGDLAIDYFTNQLMDWVPACRKSPDGFSSQVQFLKIIDDTLYSCNYGGMYRRALNDFNYPELSVPDDIIETYYNKEVGQETYITFAIGNFGFDTLKIYDVISSDSDFEVSRKQMDIPPEWGFGVNLNYKFTDPGKRTTTITVISSDTTAKNTFTVEVNGLPIDFVLQQNTPNPFNPSTKINYTLPSTAYTSLRVYNSIGELVSVLAEEVQDGGEHTAIFNAGNLSAGVYFYQLQSGSIFETKKMVLIK